MRPLSDLEPKVSWRLNDLLRAGQKAQAFAAVSWSHSDEDTHAPFRHWQPNSITNNESDRETGTDDDSIKEDDIQLLGDPVASEEQSINTNKQSFEEGYTQGKEAAESELHLERQVLIDLVSKIKDAQKDPSKFFDPLKKLSIHLAEQLVRGELNLSSDIVDRLVKAALDDIDTFGDEPVIVYLHPLDLKTFNAHLISEIPNIEQRADQQLSRGSVCITVGDTAIEDFLEHRLKNLAEEIIKPSSENNSMSNIPLSDANNVDSQDTLLEEEVPDDTIAPVSDPDQDFLKEIKDNQTTDSVDDTSDDNV